MSIFDLCEKFSNIDDDITLKVSSSNGTYSVGVMFGEEEVYFFSSTDKLEVIERVNGFYRALLDSDLFDRLQKEIEEEKFEVVANV